jgi:D-alanyl-D-alanine carboxypeptidase (penicillin-binding protein 5/6)
MAATSYLLADLGTGEVLATKGPHVRALPASTLKTLTALTLMPVLSPGQHVTAVPQDVVEGSKVGLAPGSSYSVQQLMEGMMLSSGNDAATALARAGGGVPQTVAAMQEKARSLGALDTVVKDPSGLDAPGQVTSAYDLALIARAALELPAFRQVAATRRVRFPGAALPGVIRKSYEIQNHNSLLFNYPGALGVKNGYTVAARWTIVGAATRGTRTYVVTALGRTDRSWRPTAALLDWAFAHGEQAEPIGRLVEPGEAVGGAAPVPPTAGADDAAGSEVQGDGDGTLDSSVDGSVDGEGAGEGAGGGAVLPAVPPQSQSRSQSQSQSQSSDGTTSAAPALSDDRGLGTWIGIGGLSAAALLVLVLALSAHARRQQLRQVHAARSARRARR